MPVREIHFNARHTQRPLHSICMQQHVAQDIAATPSLLGAYKKVYAEFCDELERFCARYQLGYVRTQTEVPFEDVILQVFRQNRFLT